MRIRSGTKRALLTVGGAALGLTLAVVLAVPAQAAAVHASAVHAAATHASKPSPNAASPAATSPALKAWLAKPVISATSLKGKKSSGVGRLTPGAKTQSVKSATLDSGLRITEYRGSSLLWTQNILEWYWSSSKITSSNGTQSVGYIFPNTAKGNGLTKTYSVASYQNWRGKETVGAGVVTPWGNVDVYETTQNDYFVLNRGGAYSYSTS
jgi:hypothetical protein